MPFPYSKIIAARAASSPAIMLAKDVTIAQLIVGKRHCRVLTLGN